MTGPAEARALGRGGWFLAHLRRSGTLRGRPADTNGQQVPAARA
jgi:hypothetical protein